MEYKFLTSEQRKQLDAEIMLHGRDETYIKIAKNICLQRFAELTNEDDAWDIVSENFGNPVYRWYSKLSAIELTDLEKEILNYIGADIELTWVKAQ